MRSLIAKRSDGARRLLDSHTQPRPCLLRDRWGEAPAELKFFGRLMHLQSVSSTEMIRARQEPRPTHGLLLLLVFFFTISPLWAASPNEAQAFSAAEKVYVDADYKNAEAYFGDFIQRFPNSIQRPEAVLYQAQSRLKLHDYEGALSLLAANQNQAGALADWYLLCQGEALLAKGDFSQAETNFTKLMRDFPASPHRLTGMVDAAVARMRLSQWPQVIELLGRTNSVLQLAAATNRANPDVIRGYLLLSEAQLAQNDLPAAEQSLQYLAASPLDATNNWQRQYLLCRVFVAGKRLDEAMSNTTNLLVLADATGQPAFQAQSIFFQAGLLEQSGRRSEALDIYQKTLAPGFPADRQRDALLKIAQLSLALGRTPQTVQTLESFLTQFPTNECSDLALLTVGELRLKQYDSGSMMTNQFGVVSTNTPGATNLLQQAMAAFDSFGNRFPRSSLAGKAQLNLGWCYWLAGNVEKSQSAFQNAINLLPPSAEQAQAFFKLADTQFELTNYLAAITNYSAVVDRFNDIADVRTNLSERALYQMVRASQVAGDDTRETNALARIMTQFPDGLYTQRAVSLAGQHVGVRFPAMARALFGEVARTSTNSLLQPQIQLAIARTYEEESNWEQAIRQYDSWLATFTNSPAQDQAEYLRARAYDGAGRDTNALTQFTNMIARFPTSEYAPLAQWRVADYYYGLGNPQEAEINYKLVYQNWPSSKLAYPARMMAGRSAVVRQDWEHAPEYFRLLWNETNCPGELRAQALFAYGDTFLSRNGTNDYQTAFNLFNLVCNTYTNKPIAALAWGQKAICRLQIARVSQDYGSATNDFQQVIDSPLADASARSIAEVGMGFVLEKIGETKADPEQTEFFNAALRHYQRVFYDNSFLREGESPDPFWTRKAGLEEARLAERLKMPDHAINVYLRLQQMFPPLRLDDKIKTLQTRR